MKDVKRFVLALPFVLGIIAVGCQSHTVPPPSLIPEKQTVPVFTDPQGAKVMVDGIPQGETPLSLSLEKNKDHMVVIIKEGYRPEAIPISRKLDPQDLAVKSVLRMTDPVGPNESRNPFEEIKVNEITGRAYQLQPQVINITLKRINANAEETPNTPQS